MRTDEHVSWMRKSILTKEEGGHRTPFVNNYCPQIFVHTTNVTVSLTHPEGAEDPDDKFVMPGDNVEMQCELTHDVALEDGQHFTIHEGGKTVGTGVVTKIIE
ncbi:hypothetical protein G6F48_010650 [Rhizopus delemar]|nr:hypothetical protein G6F54_009366 [Rhizopus delemar]KAG1580151.1 hypothetical protein G6F48_010650 [Rhizopus delemar]